MLRYCLLYSPFQDALLLISDNCHTTYTWDYRNRLTDLRTYDDEDTLLTHVHYTYDGRDLRIGKDVDATGSGAYTRGERYVYDVDDNLVLVYAVTYASGVPVAGSLATRQFSAATYDALFASESATGAMFWALTDHLGTVRDVTDSGGDAVAHFTYGAFGEILSVTTWDGSGPPTVSTDPSTIAAEAARLAGQTYTAREWDPDAGMFYYRARWFDQAAGRFPSDDPLGFGAGDVNVQRYVGNDVTRAKDPTGLEGDPVNPWNPFTWFNGWFNQAIPNDEDYDGLIREHDGYVQEINRRLGTNYFSIEQVSDDELRRLGLPTNVNDPGSDPRILQANALGGANNALGAAENALHVADTATTAAEVLSGAGPAKTAIKETIEELAERKAKDVAETSAKNIAKKSRANKLPCLDSTGKVHGDLPHPKDLSKYDPDELRNLLKELQKSVQERIRKNSELGPKGDHGKRQGQEQDLIHAIERYLSD